MESEVWELDINSEEDAPRRVAEADMEFGNGWVALG
jgi:hypothetical protein